MKTTMDFIKKNWITIAIVVVIVAVIIYFMKKKKKTANSGGSLNRTPAPDESKAGLQRQLANCEQSAASVRLVAGAIHPCAGIRDAVAKTSSESNYSNGDNNIGDNINVVDYAIGDQGMAMLTESNFAIKLPGMGIKESANYDGAFSSTNGLNVVDFASGLEGTSLLLDKNMRASESKYESDPRTMQIKNIRAH